MIDDVIKTLSSVTCETQGVGDLFRSEFSHTCIPAPFSTLAIYNIVSPGIYPNTLIRLKINDDELFSNEHGGACGRNNRIDYNDQKLSFAMCNNIDLSVARAKAIPKAAVAIARSFLEGSNPWSEIKGAWNVPKSEYHKIYQNKKEGESGVMLDVGIIPVFPWKVIKDKDKMCVATLSLLGWIPVGCKYIKEPFPTSIYANFLSINEAEDKQYKAQLETALLKCNGYAGCYHKAYSNSKTGIVITAPIIECIKEMATRLLVSRDLCSFDDVNLLVRNQKLRESSVLFQFQKNMHKAVTALLTIYIILFGFKILLTGDVPSKADFANFVIKFIFVTYFSVGINVNAFSGLAYDKLDGMIQWIFPFLLNGISAMSSWIMAATPSGLCSFSASEYQSGFGHISLWDSLDCKISHYLGLDVIKTMVVENASRKHDFANFDVFNFSIPPYYYLLVPAVLTGNMTLVSLALMYPLLVISVSAYLVNATVICMICIVILGILAPLFVPMLLFNYTKGFFESWVRLMLSFLLQPMVIVIFMVTLFSVYDVGFYGTCKYAHSEVSEPDTSGNIGRRVSKVFYVDNEWSNYTEEEKKGCKRSLGFILNNPMAAFYDYTKQNVSEVLKVPENSKEQYMGQFAFLGALAFAPSLFFMKPKIAFDMLKDLILALITACFSLYLLYHLSAQLSNFAADIAGGVSLSSVTIGPQAIFKAGMSAFGSAGGMKGVGQGNAGKLAQSTRGGGTSGTSGASGSSDSSVSSKSGSEVATSSSQTAASSAGSSTGTGSSTGAGTSTSSGATSNSRQAEINPRSLRDTTPMEKITSSDASAHLSKFFHDKNIDSSQISGFYGGNEFARYMAFSSDASKFDKVKDRYEAVLRKTMESPNMQGHQAEFVNRIEGMYTGPQKEQMQAINDKVLAEFRIARTIPSERDKYHKLTSQTSGGSGALGGAGDLGGSGGAGSGLG